MLRNPCNTCTTEYLSNILVIHSNHPPLSSLSAHRLRYVLTTSSLRHHYVTHHLRPKVHRDNNQGPPRTSHSSHQSRRFQLFLQLLQLHAQGNWELSASDLYIIYIYININMMKFLVLVSCYTRQTILFLLKNEDKSNVTEVLKSNISGGISPYVIDRTCSTVK